MAEIEPTYPPVNTLKPVADDVWIVDGPLIRFGLPGLKVPFPTRMTLARIAEGLFVHSPTPLAAPLKAEIERLGTVRWIVGPNRLHYWWIPQWKAACPEAEVWLAPRVRDQARGRIAFPASELNGVGGYPWDDAIATLPVRGRFLTEIVFFHRPSRTLILTDLIENFEAHKLGPWLRRLARLGGVADPDGGMPRDMRLGFLGRRAELRCAVETMIAWQPDRIILAHGRWYDANAVDVLRRAFRWVWP